MRKILIASLTAFLVHAPTSVAASFKDGNGFLANSDVYQTAYVVGVVDSMSELEPKLACFPRNVTAGQLTDVAKKDLTANPESRHRPAASLIIISLMFAFPCK